MSGFDFIPYLNRQRLTSVQQYSTLSIVHFRINQLTSNETELAYKKFHRMKRSPFSGKVSVWSLQVLNEVILAQFPGLLFRICPIIHSICPISIGFISVIFQQFRWFNCFNGINGPLTMGFRFISYQNIKGGVIFVNPLWGVKKHSRP